jgi:hypothetical protein
LAGAAAILAACGAAALAPAADAAWAEQALCRPCGKAPRVDVAVAPGGLTAVLWVSRDRVEAAVRTPGGRFSAPERLGEGPGARGPVRGDLAVGEDGTIVAAWEERLPAGVADRAIQVAVRPPGGPWGAPEQVAVGVLPEVAVGRDGTAFVSLNADAGDRRHVRLAVRPPGGEWTLEEVGAASDRFTMGPQIALSGDRVMVVWMELQIPEQRRRVMTAVREGGVWQEPQQFPGGVEPSIALDPGGTAHAVWRVYATNATLPSPVLAASQPRGGTWGAATRVSPDDRGSGAPAVGIDAAGNVMAAWSGAPGDSGVSVARRDPLTGTWGAPETLATSAPREAPALAVAPSGQALVAWDRDGAAGRISVLAAGGSSLSGRVGSPETVSAPGAMAASFPSFAAGVDREGRPTVAWVGAGPTVWVATPATAAGRVRLTAAQLGINQRISQAAIRRLNAIRARIDGLPAPEPARGEGGAVTVSLAQLRINQRISQAAVYRANLLRAQLDGALEAVQAPDRGGGGRLSLTARQLLINQRISQAAVRRVNAIADRIPDLPVPHPPLGQAPVRIVVGTPIGAYRFRINQVARGQAYVGRDVGLVFPSQIDPRLSLGACLNVSGEGIVAGGAFFPSVLSLEEEKDCP